MHDLSSGTGLAALCDAGIKGLIILGFSECGLAVWKRASAGTRHAVRFGAIASAILLPLASFYTPAARQPIWAIRNESASGNEVNLTIRLVPAKLAQPPAKNVEARMTVAPAFYAKNLHLKPRWAAVVLIAWGLGALSTFIPLLCGIIDRRRLIRGAKRVEDSGWKALLAEAQNVSSVRRRVCILKSSEEVIPLTWGWFRPVILLPDCADLWSSEKRRLTLAHELAHVKRWDCLTQTVAQCGCALHWFNPLIWRCERQMRLDREKACDDLVVGSGWKASDYATNLIEIASSLRARPIFSGVSMARPSQLEQRVRSLLATTRSRGAPSGYVRIAIVLTAVAFVLGVAAQRIEGPPQNKALREKQLGRLRRFSAEKEQHADALLAKNNEEMIPEFRKFFAAAKEGQWQTVTNMYADFKRRHGQYSGATGDLPHTPHWQTVLEVCLAYADVTWGEPEHVQMAIDGFMKSIPKGTVYFGGSDPGRGLPTAFSKNHVQADPFFTLTQNALADATYLEYLRATYGDRLYTPSAEDSNRAFEEYIKDATARFHAGKLKPGEDVRIEENRTQVSGQVAVMEINARLAKVIFDKNPDREFYIEESFPLDWMYPHLSPAGQVMKIHRKPLTTLSEEIVRKDAAYWNERVERFLGAPLQQGISMKEFVELLQHIYVRHELPPKADPGFFSNDWAQRAFSKWRSGSAGIYAWRAGATTVIDEPNRMQQAAEFAFRQACLLCPASPEAVYRYAKFLTDQSRPADAIALLETVLKISPENEEFRALLQKLRPKKN